MLTLGSIRISQRAYMPVLSFNYISFDKKTLLPGYISPGNRVFKFMYDYILSLILQKLHPVFLSHMMYPSVPAAVSAAAMLLYQPYRTEVVRMLHRILLLLL